MAQSAPPPGRKRVLLAGAGGMIGEALVERLAGEGHELVLAVRNEAAAQRRWPQHRHVRLDYADPATLEAIAPALRGVDVMVNAVGIFDERGEGSFEAVHVNGPCSLFAAAARAGVARLIQLSALGASAEAPTAYWRSKARGDACAERHPGLATVVQPSLVFDPAGVSSRLFLRLATLPWLPLPEGGRQQVQPLLLDDLVEGLAALIDHPDPPRRIAAVGPQALSLADYLRDLAASLGSRPRIVAVPRPCAAAAAWLLQRLPGRLLTPDALAMLSRPNCADPGPWQALLGRPMRAPARFVTPAQASGLRLRARLANLLPWLRLPISATWLATAWVSAFVYPRDESLALLARAQVPAALAPAALYGAAALDAVLGVSMWWPRWRAWSYRAQIALIVFYTVIISLWLPEFWAHPYGPLLKNLPMLALIYALLRLEAPYGLRRR